MRIKMNLVYRVKRMFMGEKGIVTEAEPLPPDDISLYKKDSAGELPQRVTIRNQLGEIVTALTPLTHRRLQKYANGSSYPLTYYKRYNVGDKFP